MASKVSKYLHFGQNELEFHNENKGAVKRDPVRVRISTFLGMGSSGTTAGIGKTDEAYLVLRSEQI